MRTVFIAILSLIFVTAASYARDITVFRLRGPDHLYTISCDEAKAVQSSGQYTLEYDSLFFHIQSERVSGFVPLYRYYGQERHFYTTSDNAEGVGFYRLEGITGYVSPVKTADTVPVYRAYNPNSGEHFLTAKESEYNGLRTTGQWQMEGAVFYVPSTGVEQCSPRVAAPRPTPPSPPPVFGPQVCWNLQGYNAFGSETGVPIPFCGSDGLQQKNACLAQAIHYDSIHYQGMSWRCK
ncbi:hypothetical protein [Mesorhizobium sp. M0678]|uniref:hypothetical protein n=1 Tax=Mesorhizobium sp. M0678 TaxID=2956985 RepID=UPI00333AC392